MAEAGGAGERINAEVLEQFCADVLTKFGLEPEDAAISAKVLLASDLRGIDSHGVPRMPMYTNRLREGAVNLHPNFRVVAETPATIAFDADNGMGHPAAYRAMKRCIEKAKETGLCMATVRRSNHFGIAGFYAMMALEEGLCGMAMTNATPLVVPTFAKEPYLSTAPIAIAIPAGKERPIVIDMATSTVAWGKVEIARREEKPLPAGWALDREGRDTTDPEAAVSLTPLGWSRELGSHKGYGLALFVEVLCGQLAGAAWSRYVSGSRTVPPRPANIGHAFMAWRIDAFRPEEEFRAEMDQMLGELRAAEPIAGHDRVYVPGDPEDIALADRLERGIPVHPKVVDQLRALGEETGVPAPF
ncbi:MAG TPA: Ldh family oxidoreductase [Thermomicrobiaceae bacterium]|nr:Ldh family oxidoreductase [Thermomicrobiaceae bacterium]